ncbi:four helix bundle protein [Vibrio coralliirubri]|uniref:four helix bundle protein n=1 Tax=Vibrio coralliirubri TaxID=1516159 RepID=UPI00076AC2AA|nr:four helix bundle protein [Vibrio coralliirubri]
MAQPFKHHRIYYDLQKLYKLYWNQHKHFPRAFRFTTGEQLLEEITSVIRNVVLANLQSKSTTVGKERAAKLLMEVNASLETISALLLLAWEMTFLSHGGLAVLTECIGHIQRQVVGWRRWFLDGSV